jgi:GT2 family glycosyltransferase
MGTYWNKVAPAPLAPVQVAACPGTVLTRKLYERLGGYDEGMLIYAAAEPEFSIRAWLSGARILALPQVEITHRFKTKQEIQARTAQLRPYMVHNAVRFAICYLDEPLVLQTMRQHSILFREQALEGLRMLATSDVYERREQLRASLRHDFAWFVRKFKLKDQAGRPIPTPAA